MEPSAGADGEYEEPKRGKASRSTASMEPSAGADGESLDYGPQMAERLLLQWSRRPEPTVRAGRWLPGRAHRIGASMEPSAGADGESRAVLAGSTGYDERFNGAVGRSRR